MRRLSLLSAAFLTLLIVSGCVYYNTFYHARKAFNEAESGRKAAGRTGGKAYGGQYNKAIEKSQKVLDKYPNSSWYDDALFVNGVSSFYTEDYDRAERRFRELLANYPESEYVKEGRLYLAKAKMKLGDEEDAMALFENLYQESKEKSIRTEAAMTLGEYYFESKKYPEAERYFNVIVDSLGDRYERIMAQLYIADGHFARYNYRKARENYLKVLSFKPDLAEEFRATYKAGECSIFIYEIEDGMGYLKKLADNKLFYDSLPAINLLVAYGHELNGDLSLAEEVYKRVANSEQKQHAAYANYNLGLIYQYDYENYKKAKEYYDLAKSGGYGTPIQQDALQRSADIGKLEEYTKKKTLEPATDTAAPPGALDSAAMTQYLLAELYLMQLGKPDSALNEFQYVIQHFESTYIAPKAMIATALLYRDQYNDTLAFDTTLRAVLKRYPRSDFIPQVIDLLGLAGTAADTGYAQYYYRKAESFAFDSSKVDSARYYFQLVADSFPKSHLYQQARFALLWLTETYESPGDSSLYFAYADFADSFPRTDLGKEAEKRLSYKPGIFRQTDDNRDEGAQAKPKPAAVADRTIDTTEQRTMTTEEKYFIGPDGDTLMLVQEAPIRVDREFRYPPAAYTLNFEGSLYFQVKIDPFGDVVDLRLMNPSPSPELNQEATEIVALSHFNTGWIPPDKLDSWFVYKYFVALPKSIR